jgi:hypothetical protein
MTILNKETLYYLSSPSWDGEPYKEVRGDMFVWPYYEEKTELYYCYEFANGNVFDVFPLDTLLSAEQIEQIRNGTATLVLSNSHEGFHYIVQNLYDSVVLRHNIPPQHIELISESADIASHITTVANKLGLPEMKSRWMRRFEHDIQHNRKIMNDTVTLESKKYTKKFLCFNRRWRGNRTVLVALLYALDLIKHGYVSLAKADDNRNWRSVVGRNRYLMETSAEATALFDNIENDLLTNLPEFYLDKDDLTINQAMLDDSTNYLYNETYFSVVTETFMFMRERPEEYGRFLSEKTFKPVSMKHPFIIASTPHFLAKFKELGYKSFSPWINEDYDLEHDDALRMMKIVKEIERLVNLNETELEEFLIAMREICEHNYNLLMSKNDFFTDL